MAGANGSGKGDVHRDEKDGKVDYRIPKIEKINFPLGFGNAGQRLRPARQVSADSVVGKP
jgi:hypothetical protein